MSRITEITNVTRIEEAVATKIEMYWNPQTNAASINFWVQKEIVENGAFVKLEDDNRYEFRPLAINFADIANRTFMVPVAYDEEGNVTATAPVPAMLIMGAMKQAFDELYTERVIQAEMTAPTPPQVA